MNPESLRQSENQEAEIDSQIEALKESHPLITKEAYWSALKRAKINYLKLKEVVGSLQAVEVGDYDADDKEKMPARREARSRLAQLILDCKDGFSPVAKAIAESIDSSSYFFLPKDRPLFTEETSPIFGAEKYGVPELLPAGLVLPEEIWLKAFPDTKRFNEDKEVFCSDYEGINFSGQYFAELNILNGLGLSVINGGKKNSDILNSVRHESVHAVDFLRNRRTGVNAIITELIAYRIDGKIIHPKIIKRGDNPLNLFFSDYLEIYVLKWKAKKADAEQLVKTLQQKIIDVEEVFVFSAVTELLLNSETINEFIASAKSEIDKQEKSNK